MPMGASRQPRPTAFHGQSLPLPITVTPRDIAGRHPRQHPTAKTVEARAAGALQPLQLHRSRPVRCPPALPSTAPAGGDHRHAEAPGRLLQLHGCWRPTGKQPNERAQRAIHSCCHDAGAGDPERGDPNVRGSRCSTGRPPNPPLFRGAIGQPSAVELEFAARIGRRASSMVDVEGRLQRVNSADSKTWVSPAILRGTISPREFIRPQFEARRLTLSSPCAEEPNGARRASRPGFSGTARFGASGAMGGGRSISRAGTLTARRRRPGFHGGRFL